MPLSDEEQKILREIEAQLNATDPATISSPSGWTYTVEALLRAGAERILAIEPEPGNFARLAFNIAVNPGVPQTRESAILSPR